MTAVNERGPHLAQRSGPRGGSPGNTRTHRVTDEPLVLGDAVAELTERIDVHDLQVKLRIQWWHDGYAAGRRSRDHDYEQGYAAAVADLKRAQQETYQLVRRSAPVWGAHWKTLRSAGSRDPA